MPMPPGMPAYTQFVLDPRGSLWVRRFAVAPMEPERWGVFSAEGEFFGHLTMPGGFRLMDVARDAVIGVSEDEVGVERLELYHLQRN